MDEKFKNFLAGLGYMCLILFIGFNIGMFCSKSMFNVQMINNFYNGSIPQTFDLGIDNKTLEYLNDDALQDEYCTYDYHYSMCKDKPFHNRTGLYCNNTLVCQN